MRWHVASAPRRQGCPGETAVARSQVQVARRRTAYSTPVSRMARPGLVQRPPPRTNPTPTAIPSAVRGRAFVSTTTRSTSARPIRKASAAIDDLAGLLGSAGLVGVVSTGCVPLLFMVLLL